jgi:hypothetical protein
MKELVRFEKGTRKTAKVGKELTARELCLEFDLPTKPMINKYLGNYEDFEMQ